MHDTWIITVFVVFDELCHTFLGNPKYHPKMLPAEIMTVAVVAVRYFNNNLERALLIMSQTGYIPKPRCLSVPRFNRQLHHQADFLGFCLHTLMELSVAGEAFIIDSLPVPVCQRGRAYCGYCAAKREKFFGWRLHLICTPQGVPVAFELLSGAYHDLTPLYELTAGLPPGVALYGDRAYNDAKGEGFLGLEGLCLVPIRKVNMPPHDWADEHDLARYRHGIETVNRQLESMGVEHWGLGRRRASTSRCTHHWSRCGTFRSWQIRN